MNSKAEKVIPRECPACGTTAVASYGGGCRVCGKLLSEDYQPLDMLRASYGLQRAALVTPETAAGKTAVLFATDEKNAAAQISWASFVYSLVPYLGILFIPFTLASAAVGYAAAARRPVIGGERLAATSFGLSFPVLALQIFLWWLLYIIPELAR